MFHTFPVEISEFLDKNLRVELAVEGCARDKAQALVESGRLDPAEPSLILSADTVVVLGDEILGKPKDQEDAFRTLKKLSGNTHRVITAYCLWHTGENRHVTGHSVSEVVFRELSDQEIKDYIATGDPMDKAGSYGIQTQGGTFVQSHTGTMENIAGLPVDDIEKRITKEGWKLK